jgi:choline dehydrogenase
MEAGYFADPIDLETLREGVRIARQSGLARPFDPYRGPEYLPGEGIVSDEALDAHIRATCQKIYHQAGTCRMGADAGAVVDPALRVNGVAGLRVVDASIMPVLVAGNTNAPVIAIAEKAAELIAASIDARAPGRGLARHQPATSIADSAGSRGAPAGGERMRTPSRSSPSARHWAPTPLPPGAKRW